jgi:hypothetical protein
MTPNEGITLGGVLGGFLIALGFVIRYLIKKGEFNERKTDGNGKNVSRKG